MLADTAHSIADALDGAANLFDDARRYFDGADDVTFAAMMTDVGAGIIRGLDTMRAAHERLGKSIHRVEQYVNDRAGRMTGNSPTGQN